MKAPHRLLRMLSVALAAVLLSACAPNTSGSARPEPPARPSSAPPPPTPPKVGSCHDLTLAQATAPVESRPAAPCTRPHTSTTYRTGRLELLQDGHLLAVDSRAARRQLAEACAPGLGRFLGVGRSTLRLSRFESVWFAPSLEQADSGAMWFRCDVVLVRSKDRLLPLPRKVRGALDRPGALARFGTCGTTAPGTRKFQRVVCSEKHRWRVVQDVNIDPGAHYLGKRAKAAGDKTCRRRASDRAASSLKLTWSFEWPTRQQWADGQRYGLCWVPDRR